MWWSNEMIKYYQRAASISSFHKELATLIESLISKDESIVELGCGLGYLSAELARRGYNITGLDNDEGAIAFAKEHFPSVNFVKEDAYKDEIKADVSLCVFFGRILEEDNLTSLLSTASSRLIYLTNEHNRETEPSFNKSKALSDELKRMGIKHSVSYHTLNFDQPLIDEEDAKTFLSSSYRKDIPLHLIPSNRSDYKYLLPKVKAFGIFTIHKEEN